MKSVAYVVFGGLSVLLLLVCWGVLIEPRLIDEEHHVADIPGLPRSWQGQQIALIADLQVGIWLANTDTIRRIVTRLVEKRPAAVLIAGDFAQFIAVCRRANTCEIGENHLSVFDSISGFQERLTYVRALIRPPALQR